MVRRTFEALGLPVSRLMRVRFGIVNLPPRLKRGMMAELGEGEVRQVMEWAGLPIPDASLKNTEPPQRPHPSGSAARVVRNDAAKTLRGRHRNKTKTGATF